MLNFGNIKAYDYFNSNTTIVETINQFIVRGDASIETYSDVPKTVSVAASLLTLNFKVNIKADGLNFNGVLVALNQNGVLKTSDIPTVQATLFFSIERNFM